jgi:glycosyltransferase involved in cell wall biosynthesis
LPDLLIVSSASLLDMQAKGNLSYLTHYCVLFEKVTVAYWAPSPATDDCTGCVELRNLSWIRTRPRRRVAAIAQYLWAFSVAPARIWKLYRERRPDAVMTGDMIFSFWTMSLLRLANVPVVLVPVSLPESIFGQGGSYAQLPTAIERLLLRLSLRLASVVLVDADQEEYVSYFRQLVGARLRKVSCLVESMPPPEHFGPIIKKADWEAREFRLVTVSRLHTEKGLDLLLRVLARLQSFGVANWTAWIIGDGGAKTHLEQLAQTLGIRERVCFAGWQEPAEIAQSLRDCDVYVSVLTGTALREAALAGLPVIAMNSDWVTGTLRHRENALLVTDGDESGFAEAIAEVFYDRDLGRRLAGALNSEIRSKYGIPAVIRGLSEGFAISDPVT